MTGDEFIRRVRRLARRENLPVDLIATRGKGSHATLYYGDRRTIVKDRRKELSKGLLHAMCSQLGIDIGDL